MEATERRAKQRLIREAIAQRLDSFYTHVKACVDVDCEDFYRRVLQQAQTRPEHRSHA